MKDEYGIDANAPPPLLTQKDIFQAKRGAFILFSVNF